VKQKEIISAFTQLGKLMVSLGNEKSWDDYSNGLTQKEYNDALELIERQKSFNGWFTKENVQKSFVALGENLTEEKLVNWVVNYSFSEDPKSIAVIMAGNIPLVGFHDFLCVVLSGNKVIAKLSSEDKNLLPMLGKFLILFNPELESRISFSTGIIKEMDAVIATGSDNSIKYFEQYFGAKPHIFRKNRTSVAVIDGSETKDELEELGRDIFEYFGLGCRNVSHLLLPANYEVGNIFEGIFKYSEVIQNNKYGNNYDYNKAVYLMNKVPLLDNNFVLLRESDELFSPLAMVHYHFYNSIEEKDAYLENHKNEIQAIVGSKYIPFGKAQAPDLNDYADGVDVMSWLESV